jgi:hypothetical protein
VLLVCCRYVVGVLLVCCWCVVGVLLVCVLVCVRVCVGVCFCVFLCIGVCWSVLLVCDVCLCVLLYHCYHHYYAIIATTYARLASLCKPQGNKNGPLVDGPLSPRRVILRIDSPVTPSAQQHSPQQQSRYGAGGETFLN